MRKLHFQQITDSRFDSNSKQLLIERVKKIKKALSIDGVNVRTGDIYFLDWKDGTKQYRVNFYVTKKTRKTTWNDIYQTVNGIKPAKYKFI